ncbi:MAG TPA: hypothetical protein ENK18_13715 [Deltaproteobacteria bacterium]|nr:hypothetical protein [Deltaproteobacteria bacterium]
MKLTNRCLLVLLWTGCAAPATETPTGPTAPPVVTEDDPPSEYIYEEESPPEPTASLAEISDALQDAIDTTLWVNAAPVSAAYNAAMATSSQQCPYFYTTPDGTYWYDSCTAPSGASFDGYVFAYEAQGVLDPYSGMILDYWYAFGGATVSVPGGDRLELGGLALVQEGTINDGVDINVYVSQLQGSFAWDGAEAAGTWLETDIDPDLTLYITDIPLLNSASTFVDGGFGGLDGWAIAFDENIIFDEVLGSSCDREISGTLGIRSPDGHWYDVRFDGPVDETDMVPQSECDGCGTAYFQGEEIGEVCTDFRPLLTWGAKPW